MGSTKPTMAFIEDGTHRSTRSGDFLSKLLEPHFEITRYWDDNWKGLGHILPEEINKYDYVFFEQALNDIDELKKIRAKIIWAPMYDGYNRTYFFWKLLSANISLKVLCFSDKLANQCKQFGLENLSVKYYLNPSEFNEFKIPALGNHFFFWYRGTISLRDIKKMLHPISIDSFTYRSNPDVAFSRENISVEDIEKYKLNFVEEEHPSIHKYRESLAKANIFIAPRRKEGIGISFLEAMAMGMVVVGYDDATMNEYIIDGINGYLFGKGRRMIDFKDINNVRQHSKESVQKGYREWLTAVPRIIDFVKTPALPRKKSVISPIYSSLYRFQKNFPHWERSLIRRAYKIQMKIMGRKGIQNDNS